MHPIVANARAIRARFFLPPAPTCWRAPPPPPSPPPAPPRRALRLETATPSQIIAHVAEAHGLSVNGLRSGCRRRVFVRARTEACVLLRKKGLSYSQIGAAVNIDHTTAIAAIKRAARS